MLSGKTFCNSLKIIPSLTSSNTFITKCIKQISREKANDKRCSKAKTRCPSTRRGLTPVSYRIIWI